MRVHSLRPRQPAPPTLTDPGRELLLDTARHLGTAAGESCRVAGDLKLALKRLPACDCEKVEPLLEAAEEAAQTLCRLRDALNGLTRKEAR